MPPGGLHRIMDNTRAHAAGCKGQRAARSEQATPGMEVNRMAAVRQQTGGGYQVTATETELALIKAALAETERVSRFGIDILGEADQIRDAEHTETSRLRREIDALAMREAALRSLQKTMSEIDRAARPALRQHDLDQFRSGAGLPAQPLR